MATHRKVRIFVASPSDVQDERERVAKVVARLSREVSDPLGVTLELLGWETHAVPGMGRPQSLVNPLVDRCDIFVGVLWQRFGSPPGTTAEGVDFASGTEEEFTRAFTLWERGGTPRIMLYFSDRPQKPSETDFEQARKVEAFKQKFTPGGAHPGLYVVYRTPAQFETALHQHLLHVLFEITGGPSRAGVVPNFVVDISTEQWETFFENSCFGHFFVMYSYSWRNTYLEHLRKMIERKGELRFLLPEPSDTNAILHLMAERIGDRPEVLCSKILDARDQLLALRAAGPGTVGIRYTRCYLNHALYLFEKGGVIALYAYRPNRAPSPAIILSEGPLHRQSLAEFENLYDSAHDEI